MEVTEETLVRHDAPAARATAELRERGISIAVDDVGAGYSGLSQLATLRPDLSEARPRSWFAESTPTRAGPR